MAPQSAPTPPTPVLLIKATSKKFEKCLRSELEDLLLLLQVHLHLIATQFALDDKNRIRALINVASRTHVHVDIPSNLVKSSVSSTTIMDT